MPDMMLIFFALLLQTFTGKNYYLSIAVYMYVFQLHSEIKMIIWLPLFVLYFYTIKKFNIRCVLLYEIPWLKNLGDSFLCHINRKTVKSSCHGNHIAWFGMLLWHPQKTPVYRTVFFFYRYVCVHICHTPLMRKYVCQFFYLINFLTTVSIAMWCNTWCILVSPFAQPLLQFWIVCITTLRQSQIFSPFAFLFVWFLFGILRICQGEDWKRLF